MKISRYNIQLQNYSKIFKKKVLFFLLYLSILSIIIKNKLSISIFLDFFFKWMKNDKVSIRYL